MRIANSEGSVFELSVVRYEFQLQGIDNEYDANWLQVQIRAAMFGRAWSVTNPCLLAWEIEYLAQWLDSISLGRQVDPYCHFTEPLLSFQLIRDGEYAEAIRICFEGEVCPPWLTATNSPGCCIEFATKEVSLREAARSLLAQLQRFPRRNTHLRRLSQSRS